MTELFDFLPAEPVSRTFVHNLFAFCSRSEAGSEVISCMFVRLTVPDKCVKFRDPRLNHFGEIRYEASDVAFPAVFRSLIIANRKQLVTSYLVWLLTMLARMYVQNSVIPY